MKKVKDYSFGVIPIYKHGERVEFLLIQHTAGHWSFPKGHKEGDESEIETALRELWEETGISDCKIDESLFFVEKYEWENNGVVLDKTVKFFIGDVENKEVTVPKNEIQDYRWLDREKTENLLTYDETTAVLKEVVAILGINET